MKIKYIADVLLAVKYGRGTIKLGFLFALKGSDSK
jgi:hypothetical protein